MKKIFLFLLSLFISAPAFAADTSAFDRIMASGVIRCGYYVFPPITYRDPNTGVLSGLSVDFMNALAARASLKVEWTEEVTFGNWVPALQANRFDMVCTPMWPDLPQARAVTFTQPLFFSGKYPIVLASDPRFTSKTTLADLNNQNFSFVAQEGNMTLNTTKALVPNAKLYVLAASAGGAEYYQSIAAKKADVVISDTNAVLQWNKNNPDTKLKALDTKNPVALQQFPLVVKRGDYDLLSFLNLAIDEMNYAGETKQIMNKWAPDSLYLLPNKPFDSGK